MNKKTILILEIAWIIIGLFCLIAAIHNKVTGSGDRFYVFIVMGLVSFLMAFIRDRQRKKK
jgi:FtsH-binding integral membrane protein